MPITMGLFKWLVIETATLCNRKCPTCLRQTDPTRSRWNKDGTQKNVKLPNKIVYSIIDQAAEMGFSGAVYLYLFNEPLLDWKRYFMLARYARKKGLKPGLFTNGDVLTPKNPNSKKIAKLVDELIEWNLFVVDRYDIAMDHVPKAQSRARTKYLQSLFKRKMTWKSGTGRLYGVHLTNHYSPRKKELEQLIKLRQNRPCYLTCRMLIDHKGEMLLCCEDIMCNWDLGNIYDSSLEELWYSAKHQKIVKTLAMPGGRLKYEYCSICPLKGGKKRSHGTFLRGI